MNAPHSSESLSDVVEVLSRALPAGPDAATLQLWASDELGFHPRHWLGPLPDDRARALARVCCIEARPVSDGSLCALPFSRLDGSHGACVVGTSEPLTRDALRTLDSTLARLTPQIDEALVRDRVGRLSGSARQADRIRQLVALAHTFEHVGADPDTFAALHAQLCEVMHAESFYVVLLDPTRSWLLYPYAVDPYDHDWAPLPFVSGGLEGSLSAFLIAGGRILRGSSAELLEQAGHSDTLAQARFGPAAIDWLGVPMRIGDEVLGALVVQSYDPAVRFADSDPVTLSLVADALAAAFHRRRTREALEAEVRERTAELAQAKDMAESALAALQATRTELLQAEKLAALGRMVAGVAHEMNTPLGICMTAISHLNAATETFRGELAGGPVSRRQLESFLTLASESGGMVQRNLQRAAQLVDLFKDAAADPSAEEARSFRLDACLGEWLGSFRRELEARGIALILDCPAGVEITSRPGALSQALRELLQNAIHHAYPEGARGTLHVQVSACADGSVEIRVEDDGLGMSDDIRAQVFDPFFTTRRSHGHVGLGLHAAFNLVHHSLGGTLQAHPRADRGSCFVLTLPSEQTQSPVRSAR